MSRPKIITSFNSLLLLITALTGTAWLCYYTAIHSFTFADDAFIFFRYSHNIVNGYGPVFNIGEHVEGFTSPLWLLLISIFNYFGISPLYASTVLALFFAIISLILMLHFPSFIKSALFKVIAVLFMLFTGWYLFWITSGMETMLYTALILAASYRFIIEKQQQSDHFLSGLLASLTYLARPEGFLLILFALFAAKSNRKRLSFLAGFIPLSLTYELFRIYYYKEVTANTASAKLDTSFAHLSMGLAYVKDMFTGCPLCLLAIIPLIVLLYSNKNDKQNYNITYSIYSFIIINIVYFIIIGGDFFENHRFFVPLLPWLCLLAAKGIEDIYFKIERTRPKTASIVTISTILTMIMLSFNKEVIAETHGINWITAAGKLGVALHSTFPKETLVASSHIGALGYYSKLPVLDLLGLTDKTIAHTPINDQIYQTYIKRDAGHERFNIKYSLNRNPQIIVPLRGYTSKKATHISEIKESFAMEYVLMGQLQKKRDYFVDNIPIDKNVYWMILIKKSNTKDSLN